MKEDTLEKYADRVAADLKSAESNDPVNETQVAMLRHILSKAREELDV